MKLERPDLIMGGALIDGAWIQANDGRVFAVRNPADGALIAEVADCGAAEAKAAVDAAAAAFPAWRARLAKERSSLLRRWFDLLTRHQEDLARLISGEQGKSLVESRAEAAYGAAYVEWFAEEAKRDYGDVIPETMKDHKFIVIKQPVGVVAAITPWNFPIAMIARKIAPALAAGCTVVGKPASATPLSALAIAKLAQEAGIPDGVLNIVTSHSAGEVVDVWIADSRVRKLTFTGSTETGKRLARACTDTLKRVSLELGGNAPFIVFDDADLDAAVQGTIASKFRNSGQTCVCANRILVQDGVYDAFSEKLAVAVAKLRVGSALEEEIDQGPLINKAAIAKIEEHLTDALERGGTVILGGKRHPRGELFFQPTVMTGATAEMKLASEETFGPLAALFRFNTEAEAIALANNTEYGLAGYFYSRDLARIFRVAEALEVGMVGINEGRISTEVAPFGGIKESGYGREGSKYGIEDYQQIKYLCIGGLGG